MKSFYIPLFPDQPLYAYQEMLLYGAPACLANSRTSRINTCLLLEIEKSKWKFKHGTFSGKKDLQK